MVSQQIVHGIVRRHPSLERHPARTGDLEAITVHGQLTNRGPEPAMTTVEPDEFVEIGRKAHVSPRKSGLD